MPVTAPIPIVAACGELVQVQRDSVQRFFDRRTLIRLGFSLGLLAFLFWRLDLEAAADALAGANYVYVIPALAIFGVAKLLVAQRWRLMMSTFADVPLGPAFGVLLISNLANNILPMRLGTWCGCRCRRSATG
jgi:uncharacterized membrane protein YbhN (UPF0104 family)